MYWPSNSPDLNPIENVWGYLKSKVYKRMAKNLTELESFLLEEWENIPDELFETLYQSMPRRMADLK